MRSGLEVGTRRAVLVRLAEKGGAVALRAAAIVEAGEGGAKEADLAADLRRALDAEGAGRLRVSLGAGGRDAILRYLRLPPVPKWRLRLLMEQEVRDAEERAGEGLGSDYASLDVPAALATPQSAGEIAVLVALAKEAALARSLAALRKARIEVACVAPAAVALFNAYVALGNVADGRTVLLLDAGEDAIELAAVRDGLLVFARSIPRPAEAAAIDTKEAQKLAGAIAAALQYAKTQQKLRALVPDEVLLSGRHARSDALRGALEQAFKLTPSLFDPLEQIDLEGAPAAVREALAGRGPELAVATGLALAGAHPRTIELDLSPAREKARREFLARTVFLYAAAALVLLTLLVTGGAAWAARRTALARGKELRALRGALESRRADLEALALRNRAAIGALEALSRRTEAGAALIRLLDRLRVATPPRVTLTEIAMEEPPPAPAGRGARGAAAPEKSGDAARREVAFRLRGEVDDATGEAARFLADLEAALREDPFFVSAKLAGTPVARAGALLDFAMSVRVRGRGQGEP
jgi:Tfp pilus assembly PilM family ATPase